MKFIKETEIKKDFEGFLLDFFIIDSRESYFNKEEFDKQTGFTETVYEPYFLAHKISFAITDVKVKKIQTKKLIKIVKDKLKELKIDKKIIDNLHYSESLKMINHLLAIGYKKHPTIDDIE